MSDGDKDGEWLRDLVSLHEQGNGWNPVEYPGRANDAEREFRDRLVAEWPRILPILQMEEDKRLSAPSHVATMDCPKCKGSGEVLGMTQGRGPDDYGVPLDCRECKGTGAVPSSIAPSEDEKALRSQADAWMAVVHELFSIDKNFMHNSKSGQQCAIDAIRALAARSAIAAKTFPMLDGPAIPWALAEAIWQGYARYFGGSDQAIDAVAKRGGFGWAEIALFWSHSDARRVIEAHLRRADGGHHG